MSVITTTLLAALMMQIGFLLWKVASSSLPPLESTPPLRLIKAFATNRYWIGGWIATNIGWILTIKAVDIGAISLVQPLLSSGDLFIVLMSVVFLNERLSPREWKGIGLVIIGAGIFMLNVYPVTYPPLNWRHVIIFYTMLAALSVAVFLFAMKYKKRLEILLGVTSGMVCSMGSSLTKLMTSYLAQKEQVAAPLDYIFNPIFPFMLGTTLLGLYILQMAFQKGRASIIVPIDISVMNVLVFSAGMLLFQETVTVNHTIGLAIITVGVFYLQPQTEEHT